MRKFNAFLLALALSASSPQITEGKDWFSAPVEVSFRVLDENNVPVQDAHIEGYLWSPHTPDAVGDTFKLRTDEDGQCTIDGTGYHSIVGIVHKDGYYKTEFNILLGDEVEARKQGHWSLRNATAVLKGMRNPIPMHAKRVEIEIPEGTAFIGFDMEKGDWVAPHGRGLVADVYITYSLTQEDLWTGDERFEMSNTNLLCGLQELNADIFSGFRSLYDAPLTGYAESLKYVLNRTKTTIIEQKKLSDSDYIVFRSRAVVDEEGNLESVNYGKVYPPIRHGRLRDKNIMVITYYFNPTPNDRNLEFDPKQNLFTDLKSSEQVRDP